MKRTVLIILSGFLGAGKTTLMLAAAEMLRERGKEVACVTNDQGKQLVDSKMVLKREIPLQQVEGGCFCCQFDLLADSINEIVSACQPDVIIAEAVGSCTDLAATVIKPLKSLHGDRLDVRPLTTVVDPIRLSEHFSQTSSFSPEISYVFQKQLEEARYIVLNKSDLLPEENINALQSRIEDEFKSALPLTLSALNGNGIEQWAELILLEDEISPIRVLEIDYDTYADGESQLGWLNASFTVNGPLNDAAELIIMTFETMVIKLAKLGSEIAHLKLWAQDKQRDLKISAVRNNSSYVIDCNPMDQWRSDQLTIWMNARVCLEPEQLYNAFTQTIGFIKETYNFETIVERVDCFAPSRPVPTYRMV